MKLRDSLLLIIHPRMWVVYLLGFISGLPLALTGTTLQAWLASSDVNVLSVGMITLVGLPYSYKFLWAPLLDSVRLPVLSHRRKSWIVLFQMLLAALLALFSFISPQHHLLLLSVVGFLVALVSASQDIVIDAYRTEYLRAYERGMGAASFTFAYRLAMLVSGGVGLMFADVWGWSVFFIMMAVAMVLGAIFVFLLPNTKELYEIPKNWLSIFISPFKQFLSREKAFLILGFIVLYKIGEAFTLSLSTAFFLNELHMSLTKIGMMYKVVGFIATMIGAYLAGILLPSLGIFRALLYFGLLQACANGLFVVLALVGMHNGLVMLTIALDLGSSGMATTALLTYLMSLCDLRFTGAQFALLTAIMSIGRIFSGPLAGFIVEHSNWAFMFFVGFALSLPALWMIRRLPAQV